MNQLLQTPSRVGQAFLLGGAGVLFIIGCTGAELPDVSTTPLVETPMAELKPTPGSEVAQVETTVPEPQMPIDTPAVAYETLPVEILGPTVTTISRPATLTNSIAAVSDGAGYALRFFGTGTEDIDRVKIPLDDPATNDPGPPADIGATDFTMEWWLRAELAENQSPPVACGPNNVNWIYGNVIFDRDRYNQDRKFGVSLAAGLLVFGISGDGTGDYTICGTSQVADGQWHHVAIQRRRVDGYVWLFVDGRPEAEGVASGGDVSYPDEGQPGDFCNGPCVNSDPFLVIGAEKHDVGPEYPSFSGWIDEVRLSTVLRYSNSFTRPTTPFQPDADTAALWHFNEGVGEIIGDAAAGGLSPGILRFGGPHQGPKWVISDAPLGLSSK